MTNNNILEYIEAFNELVGMMETEEQRTRLNETVEVFCYQNDIEILYEDYDTG